MLKQADTISINGYGFSDLTMSDPVLPNTIGIIELSVDDFDFDLVDISNITKLGGQFRIIDDATWKSYDAIFPQSGGATDSTSSKWSYSEAYDLNTYANKATTNALKALDYAVDAMTASSTYKVLYNQYAVYYAGIAKGYLESMKAIADSNAELTLTNTNGKYSTLQEKIDYAYELCDEIVNLQITSSNYATYEDKILDITQELSLECLGIQKLSVDLIGAFVS